VSTPDAASVTAVNLVSMGADTHQSDMDQHFVPLSFTRNGTTLSVQAPAGGTIAPAGTYMLFLVNGNGVPSVAAQVRILPSLTAPSAPSNVTAVAGNTAATVSWSAPGDGGSPITSYTVTPYAGTVAQTPVTVSGATSTQVTGLTNGTAYTFTVTATNAVGTSPPSAASNAVTPSATPAPGFVQQAGGRGLGATRAVTMPSTVLAGDRMVVEVGVWNSDHATATGVTDTAGNTYTRLSTKVASDGTELSVWSAPITAGGGTKPTVTARVSSSADVGVAAVEYSGLSPVAGTGVVDQTVSATGTTAVASSGQTAATTADGELAVGFYTDSGFGRTLTAGAGFSQRVNVSPAGDMEFLVEDQPVALGGRPNATIGTAANTPWIVTTIVFKHG
jgi:hypothetical protein